MESLPLFMKLGGRAVVLVGTGPAADAKARLLVRAGARIVGADDHSARLAIVVLEDGEHAAMTADLLRQRGMLVNAVDRPAISDFTFPAIVERGPVTVAIGTGGASAGLAKALRGAIEALLPSDVGGLAKALASARAAIRARWPEADARRHAIDAALGRHGPLDPLVTDGSEADGAERVTRWLDTVEDDLAPVRLATVRLRSPDPDELTLRAARLLTCADRVYHRPDVPSPILVRARADAERIPCAAPPAMLPRGLSVDIGFA